MTRESLLARTFVELADILVDDFDLVELAQTLAERCVELFDVDAAGLLLAEPSGELRVLASSSDQLRVVELFELQSEEGPCFDCYRSGAPVVNLDLATLNGRWPNLAPVALAAGFRSVHALPVRLRHQVIGALNLFRTVAEPFELGDIVAAQAVADATAIAILQQRALQEATLLTGQLTRALASRVVIEQAKGMLAERAGVDLSRSFVLLRTFARSHNRQLTAVCEGVIDGSVTLDDLLRQPRP